MKRSPLKRKTPLRRGLSQLRRTPLAKVSRKRRKEQKVYSKSREEYLREHPYCECRHLTLRKPNGHIIQCSLSATQIHHKSRRHGKNFTDRSKFLATCGNCHQWIEENGKEAEKLGLLIRERSPSRSA